MKALVLRLDAPMISFGSVIVDQHGYTDFFPGKSMFTGMIGNALGWYHSDFDQLQSLQNKLDFAARWDVQPHRLIDYHTVDLGSPKMSRPGWTTNGVIEHRSGGLAAKYGTHQRYRHYLVDGLMTAVLTVMTGDYPNLEQIEQALRQPARPLFLGRKTCLPARPILDPINPVLEGSTLVSILEQVPVWNRKGKRTSDVGKTWACWTTPEQGDNLGETRQVYDLRDWAGQIPAGSRWRTEGMIGGGKGG